MADGVPVPVLETPRLRLREPRIEDFEDIATMWADENVVRFITGKPSGRSDSWSRLLRHIGHWQALSYGYWSVEERETGRFCGHIGFAEHKRDITPSIEGVPEIGWVLATHAHGRGIATEAVAAAVQWGDRHFSEPRTVCLFDPDNAASMRVAEKNGYRVCCMARMNDKDTLMMERMRAI
ncbi:GNAT family N-acetyltransferase [Allorhizobium sp. BGMRC 0089]|nr:GNAT family N-acetyltransferase [Allorhizobium sonneratiae]MCM2294311.1 GNAT family N-acetyltransferase [Allorhizobium sonneratiae]